MEPTPYWVGLRLFFLLSLIDLVISLQPKCPCFGPIVLSEDHLAVRRELEVGLARAKCRECIVQ